LFGQLAGRCIGAAAALGVAWFVSGVYLPDSRGWVRLLISLPVIVWPFAFGVLGAFVREHHFCIEDAYWRANPVPAAG
jgi:hypothetical protein